MTGTTPRPDTPAIPFDGEDQFAEALDRCVTGDLERTVSSVRATLCAQMRKKSLRVPDVCFETCADRYARRLLHRSERHGYSVVAMTWAPGQGTPVHDHCGMWCVEGIWAGEIEVVQYELLERDGDRFRFEPRGCMHASVGSAGSLIPPHEYHTIRNGADEVAVSIHVYSGEMKNCNVFVPADDGWYTRSSRSLGFD